MANLESRPPDGMGLTSDEIGLDLRFGLGHPFTVEPGDFKGWYDFAYCPTVGAATYWQSVRGWNSEVDYLGLWPPANLPS